MKRQEEPVEILGTGAWRCRPLLHGGKNAVPIVGKRREEHPRNGGIDAGKIRYLDLDGNRAAAVTCNNEDEACQQGSA